MKSDMLGQAMTLRSQQAIRWGPGSLWATLLMYTPGSLGDHDRAADEAKCSPCRISFITALSIDEWLGVEGSRLPWGHPGQAVAASEKEHPPLRAAASQPMGGIRVRFVNGSSIVWFQKMPLRL